MGDYLADLQWVAVDTETTGLNPWRHELIEIGAVRFSLKGLSDTFTCLIKPKLKMDPRAREVHNISNEELDERGIELEEAVSGLFRFIGDTDMVFHNAPFDLSFLRIAADQINIPMPSVHYLDSLYLSRTHYPERKSHSLQALRAELGIADGVGHRALPDAQATAQVFSDILNRKGRNISSKKQFQNFVKYLRKADKFQVTLSKNLEDIQRYLQSHIQTGRILKLDIRDKAGISKTRMSRILDLMVFNQQLFLKFEPIGATQSEMVPLKQIVIHDPERGAIVLDN